MKRILFLFFMMSTIIFVQPTDLYGSPSNPVPIKPKSGTDPNGTGNRTPNSVPIQCFYSNGELTFIFSATLGTVECEVVRVSDNEVFDAMFYAVSGGLDSLYVSTDADDYEITLTCADGTIYYGEYTIE